MEASEPLSTHLSSRRLDRTGHALTTEDAEACEAFSDGIDGWTRHRADTSRHLERALSRDPELALAHALFGYASCFLGRIDLTETARGHHGRAARSLAERGGSARERALVCALGAWVDGRPDEAAATLAAHLDEAPTDLLALKLEHGLQFMRGRTHELRASLERAMPAYSEDARTLGRVLGCYAFALVECGELERAERIGQRAVELDALDAWGVHAVGHVYDARGDAAQGIAWFLRHEARLSGLSNFGGHVAWHRALLHVERGEFAEALDAYDTRIAPFGVRDYRDVANASTLLNGLRAAGLDVEDRARVLGLSVEERPIEHGLCFAELHLLLALLEADLVDSARRRVASFREFAMAGDGEQARVARAVGLPLADAMLLAHDGRHREAIALFERSAAARGTLGGSRAQRRIFEILERASRARCIERSGSSRVSSLRGIRPASHRHGRAADTRHRSR